MPAPAVTVVGSLNLDLVVTVGRLPGRGETVVGLSTVTGSGGKGGNQAAAAGALSAGVTMVGRVGDDSAGLGLRADLDQRGVDTSPVLAISGVTTGTATVAVEADSGENLIVVAPGANGELTAADVDIPAVRSAAVLLLQLEIPLATVSAAVRLASGVVVLNPAPPQPLPADLLERVDVLVPNEWELARLAGVDGDTHREPAELAELARQVTTRDVVVTMGGRGALVVAGGAAEPVVVAPPAVTPVDTTGAGDCFCGALCVALGRGDSLVDAVRFAVTAAALSTTAPGARGLLPDAAAVEAAQPSA
jgi:ribokinase